jgi:hypothetical protein
MAECFGIFADGRINECSWTCLGHVKAGAILTVILAGLSRSNSDTLHPSFTMSMINRFKLPVLRKGSEDAVAPSIDSEKKEPETTTADEERQANVDAERQGSIGFLDASKGTDVPVEAGASRGVQKIEAATTAWTKWALVAILCKYAITFPK